MIEEIEITALMLDSKNPRMEVQLGHRDAVRALFTEASKDMVNLSEDIATYGLSPLENIGVSPSNGSRYIVREGNRRIAALCTLHSPDLVQGVMTASLEKRLNALSKEFLSNKPIDKVECEVLPEDQWDHWLTLRHTGANEGRGLVSWGTIEKARYLYRTGAGKKAIALQFVDWYKEATKMDEAEQAILKKVPITTLKRFLDDTDVQKRLGITVTDGLVFSAYSGEEMFKWTHRVVHDLGNKKFNVRDLYDTTKKRCISGQVFYIRTSGSIKKISISGSDRADI